MGRFFMMVHGAAHMMVHGGGNCMDISTFIVAFSSSLLRQALVVVKAADEFQIQFS